jgi:hypothetical protein
VAATPQQDLAAEVEELREELRLCRLELAQVREENERVVEDHARVRRGRRKAQKESAVLAKALAEVLYRELRERAEGRRWSRRRGDGTVTAEEWQQVMLLHRSRYFRPVWYLRQHLTVARQGMEPALHFLRYGVVEARDPGPDFDVRDYLFEHPEVRSSGQNPVLHAIAAESLDEAAKRTSVR